MKPETLTNQDGIPLCECELCGDQPQILYLHGRCHMTAPLQATLEGHTLTLRCYIPECRRVVATFEVSKVVT